MAGVSIGTGFAANVLSNVLSSLWNTAVEGVKMVIFLPQAIADMEAQVQSLSGAVYDMRADLDREQRNPKRQVHNWLDRAETAIENSVTIVNEYQQHQQHKDCLGCCPNCLCRYRISKHIRDWKRIASQLQSERVQPDFPPIGEYGDPTPHPQILIQNIESGFVANAKRSAQTELVERLLTDEDSSIRIIGFLGMGGVGKTSLLDTINDSQKVGNSFELIIKVTVSKNHILDLQNCVADRLKLTQFPDKSNFEERKYRLHSYFRNKKFLLLLDDMWADDMWTSSTLQDLGASLNHRGSKIVLTTRDKEVCVTMNVQETIEVEPLLQEEGWQLFRSRAFDNRNGNVPQELEEVAREIAKECKGLPLAITVIAAAMKEHGTVLHQWQNALDQMKTVPEMFDDLHSIVDKKLFQRLKWSYDVLKSDSLKTCFLSFAAYPEDREIVCEEVIDMWVAEGMVKGSGDSHLPDTAHSFINHLRNRCLIEVVQTDEVGRISSVKVHDILRDLAIRIAEKEHDCCFKAGQGVSHFPLEEVDSDRCAKMSLMSNNLQSLPQTFACSSLSVLLLSQNPHIKEVPESFLNDFPSLRVLDLSETGITCLPPCIENLKHLVSLQLRKTDIYELPETIGNLKELQFLNVRECKKLRCLPESINELKRLRVLDMEFCSKLRHLPRSISELVSLERLDMYGSISLDFEEEANAERKNACFKDLQSLRRLRVLKVKMKSAVKEGVMGNWSKMRQLVLSFDDDVNKDELPQDMQAMKDLERFWLIGCDVERLPGWVSEFRKLACLGIVGCKQLKELPAELPCLRELYISNSDKLEELELELGMGYPKLEKLSLWYLQWLEYVGAGKGAAASGSGSGGLGEGASLLPMIKSLSVGHCPQLKGLRGGWDKLKCLEEIRGSREWWDAIQCDDPSIKISLQSGMQSNARINISWKFKATAQLYDDAIESSGDPLHGEVNDNGYNDTSRLLSI